MAESCEAEHGGGKLNKTVVTQRKARDILQVDLLNHAKGGAGVTGVTPRCLFDFLGRER